MTAGKGSKRALKATRSDSAAENVSAATHAFLKPPRRKYGNVPTVVGGRRFDSKKESERYAALLLAERAGEITGLECQTRFPLVVHGEDCGSYVSDFSYVTRSGERVIEDVKSAATRKLPTYRLKVKLVWALYGIRVREV